MQKKAILWLTLMLSALLILVVACGPVSTATNPTTPNKATTGNNQTTGVTNLTPSVTTVPTTEHLYVLDGYTPLGATGSQQIVAFHPGSVNPTTLVTLPAGLTSSDHQRLYTAIATNGQTTIAIRNTQTGATMHTFVISGTYSIAEQDFAN